MGHAKKDGKYSPAHGVIIWQHRHRMDGAFAMLFQSLGQVTPEPAVRHGFICATIANSIIKGPACRHLSP